MLAWRIAFMVAGVLLGLFGAFRLVTEVSPMNLLVLAIWMIGAVVTHDGVLSPVILAVGVLLARIPARARRYVQAALIVGGLVTVIAIPLIHKRGSQPMVKAILRRDYGANLTVVLGVIAAASLVLYSIRVARDRRGPRRRRPAQR